MKKERWKKISKEIENKIKDKIRIKKIKKLDKLKTEFLNNFTNS